jgi:hypothetical protein
MGRGLRWRLAPGGPAWRGLDLPWAARTPGEGGLVRLRIRTDGGQLLREASLPLGGQAGSGRLEFRFPPLVNAAGRDFVVEVAPDAAARARGLEVWYDPGAGGRGLLAGNRHPVFRIICEQE